MARGIVSALRGALRSRDNDVHFHIDGHGAMLLCEDARCPRRESREQLYLERFAPLTGR
jgi:hypothetical protein